MKRSGQIALVLMGVTGTTAAGAYMMPPRPQCQPAPASTPAAPAALTGDAPGAAQPCRRRSWGPWNWSSNSSRSYYSYDSRNTSSPRSWFPSTRSSNPTSTSIAPTTSGPRSTGPGTGATPRGGFGITGHSISTGS